MNVGLVGLGKMGGGIARRLLAGGHGVTGFDPDPAARAAGAALGIQVVDALADLAASGPDVVWMMVPAGEAVDAVIATLDPVLPDETVLVDGGNSNYRDTRRRHDALAATGRRYLDVGTSGGVWGADNGYCLMVGGPADQVESVRPILETLAAAPDQGWGRVGSGGAGHYVKMVHNAIEYGMMQAIAEGFALLDAHPDYEFDGADIARLWSHGSVVRSWLVDLTGAALARDPRLDHAKATVDDSGEGRWAVAEAIDLDVAAPVITHALIHRIQSRDRSAYSSRLLSALRREFGGHNADPE